VLESENTLKNLVTKLMNGFSENIEKFKPLLERYQVSNDHRELSHLVLENLKTVGDIYNDILI